MIRASKEMNRRCAQEKEFPTTLAEELQEIDEAYELVMWEIDHAPRYCPVCEGFGGEENPFSLRFEPCSECQGVGFSS